MLRVQKLHWHVLNFHGILKQNRFLFFLKIMHTNSQRLNMEGKFAPRLREGLSHEQRDTDLF